MAKIPQIFLDMDDVLVDFDRAVCWLYGLDYDNLMARRNGEWDFSPMLPGGREDFKLRMDNGMEWWAALPELPWCDQVLELCHAVGERVTIVSAPMNVASCAAGKRVWLKKKFGPEFRDFDLRMDKHELASEDALLIDDRPLNCGKFTMSGGRSLMFPAYGNPLLKYRGDMDYFARMLGKVVEDFRNEERYHGI